MTRTPTSLLLFSVTLILFAVACGDDSTGLVCGAGTVPMGGMCVPAEDACGAGTVYDAATMTCVPDGSTIMCAAGTVLMGDECVPDGSVICTAGTTYDAMSGTCIPDISDCGPGTMLVDGMCVPGAVPVGDNVEGAEPNDATLDDVTPPDFNLPGMGSSTSFSGCIVPADFDDDGVIDADYDSWTFTTDRPTMISVRVDGFGGLAGGFLVSSDDELLANDGWIRYGLDLTSSHAERRVLLPAAGTYYISFGDARSLLAGVPSGGDSTCYYATLETRALPTATPLVDGMAMGDDFGNPELYSFTATEGQLLFPTLTEDSGGVASSIVQIVDGEYAGSATGAATDPDVQSLLLDLDAGATVWLVVDNAFDISLDPVPWVLDAGDSGAQPLADGTNTFTHRDGLREWRYFDATAGDVVNLRFDGGGTDEFDIIVASPAREITTAPCFFCTDSDDWFQITDTGRHYIGIYDADGTDGTDYDVDFGVTAVTPRAITRGTAAAADLTGASRDFFRVSVTGLDWVSFDVGSLVNLTDVDVDLYPNGEPGALDLELAASESDTASASSGFGRIFEDDGTFLISVQDADGHDGDETFDFTVDDRDYVDLGSVSEATAIPDMDATFGADETLYYLVHAEQGSQVTITATPSATEDLVLRALDRREATIATADDGGDGAAEMLVQSVRRTYLPFTLSEYTGAAGAATVGVTAIDPPYSASSGTTPFVDVCAAGEVHALTADSIYPADDDGLSTTPVAFSSFTFSYFGVAVTGLTVSSNGWLTFATGATSARYVHPAEFPETAAPDAIVAPFWYDLLNIEVCTLEEANRYVVQWTGDSYAGTSVQFQAVLHDDGAIEFIYGPDHYQPTGALVGLENQDASFGLNWIDPVLFETSVLYTPH